MEKCKRWFDIKKTATATATTTTTTAAAVTIRNSPINAKPIKTFQALTNGNYKILTTFQMANKQNQNTNEKTNSKSNLNSNLNANMYKQKQQQTQKQKLVEWSPSSLTSLASLKRNEEKAFDINRKHKAKLNAKRILMMTRRKRTINLTNATSSNEMTNTKVSSSLSTTTTAATAATGASKNDTAINTQKNQSENCLITNFNKNVDIDVKDDATHHQQSNDISVDIMKSIKTSSNKNNNCCNCCFTLLKTMKTPFKSSHFQYSEYNGKCCTISSNSIFSSHSHTFCAFWYKCCCNWHCCRRMRRQKLDNENDYHSTFHHIPLKNFKHIRTTNSFKLFIRKYCCYCCNRKGKCDDTTFVHHHSIYDNDEIEAKIADYLKEVKVKHYEEKSNTTPIVTTITTSMEMYNLPAITSATTMSTSKQLAIKRNDIQTTNKQAPQQSFLIVQEEAEIAAAAAAAATAPATIDKTTVKSTASKKKLSYSTSNIINSNAKRVQRRYSQYLPKDITVINQSAANAKRIWTWDDSLRSNSDRFLETLDEEANVNTNFNINTNSLNAFHELTPKVRPSLYHLMNDLSLANSAIYNAKIIKGTFSVMCSSCGHAITLIWYRHTTIHA